MTDSFKVKDSFRYRTLHQRRGIRARVLSAWDSSQGWVAAALIGILMAIVAFLVDIAEATVSDWKVGYCKNNVLHNREACCTSKRPFDTTGDVGENCFAWRTWSINYWGAFGAYVGFAFLFGIISGGITMTTNANLPAVEQSSGEHDDRGPQGKSMYMAAGSGIPEIKTILSGFVIPRFLDFKVLFVKAVGATFAVATGMCLGKEGPFVHISTCIGYLVAKCFPKYNDNGRKMREMLSVACSSGLSVAFGAPIGGVLFSYEVFIESSPASQNILTCLGNKYVFPSKGTMESLSLFSFCRRRTEGPEPEWHWQTCPF